MEMSFVNMGLTFVAGLASVASPCVLPVIPILLTGTKEDHKHRPLLVVLGLCLTFILMGVLTSLFGSFFAGKMRIIEQVAGGVIVLFGVLILFNINPFKKMNFFYSVQSNSKGRWSGFFLGLTLGIIWIPCIGPMLSGVLAMVASKADLINGTILLFIYSLGFAVPMLIAGYASDLFKRKVRWLLQYPVQLRIFSGLLLIALGALILTSGLVAISIL